MSDFTVDALFLLNSEMSLRWMITMLHFLWQGCVIGTVATSVSFLLKNNAASLRYWVHAIALLACPVFVAATFSLVTVPESLLGGRGVEIDSAVASESSAGGVLPADVPNPAFTLTDSATQSPVLPEMVASTSGVVASRVVKTPTIAEATPSDVNADWYRTIATWAMVAYVIGVVCFLLRLSVALWGGQRLRANSIPLSDTALLALVRAQAQRIGLRLVPVVAYCERVAVPTVIGVLRPIVLLPATVMTGLTTDEFSAIVSHEFAHIRRYDLWMNLLQRLIESLLFFHHVVWFLSRRLSAEREICCDDLVVRSGHEAMNYAGALLKMAELCAASNRLRMIPESGMLAADGGNVSQLEQRIHRLMRNPENFELGLSRKSFAFVVAASFLCFASFVAVAQNGSSKTEQRRNASEAKFNSSAKTEETEDLDVTGDETNADNQFENTPTPDADEIYWSDRDQNGWMTGLKVLRWPGIENAKLVLQYVLRNSASEQRDIDIQFDSGPMSFTVDHLNRIHDLSQGIGGSSLRKTITVKPDEVVEDQTFRQEVDFSGLAPGRYAIRFSSMFSAPVEGQIGTRTGLPFSLVLPLTLAKPPKPDETPSTESALDTATEQPYVELPIHWGESVDGLRIGAKFADAPAYGIKSFKTTDNARLQLFIQNVSDQDIPCQILLPHPLDGWGLNIENEAGSHLPRNQVFRSQFSPLRMFSAELAPGEIQPMSGKLQKFREGNEDPGYAAEIELPSFLIAPKLPESGELRPPYTYGFPEGQYTARIFAQLRRSDIPNATLNVETAGVLFEIGHVFDPSRIRHPHCVVQIDNLLNRPLTDAISLFNLEAKESPIGSPQPPVTEEETREAITKFAEQTHVPAPVKAQLQDALKTGTLPSNVYFRRFTRFDDGEKMNDVWWVRLVVATTGGPVYSVPVRTTSIDSRPYTQMERQQNAADETTLLNRVSSYRRRTEDWPPRIPTMREAAIDRLIDEVKQALEAKDLETLKSFNEWTNASDSIRRFAESELQTLVDATDHSVWITPPESDRSLLITWSAWQQYKPNLPVVGYLKISYTPAGEKPDIRKRLTLELGQIGDELRLVNYVTDGDRESPKSLNAGPSITRHLEPLFDGKFLVTDTVINPDTLLSAHLANEEIRQRD